MITSTGNSQVRSLVQLKRKAKTRRQEQRFAAEGARLFTEIPRELIEQVYVTGSFQAQNRELLSGLKYELVSDEVFSYLSDTQTPQGILCVVRMVPERPELIFRPGGLWLILENIQDPGNLGTMFRTAEGAGVTGIIMDRTTADLYAPKVIRSTMGSIFRVPFLIADDLAEPIGKLKEAGARIYAADMKGSICYDRADLTGGSAFLIGNEGNGLTERALSLADGSVHIPMAGQLESLNAAVAAAVLMFEASRQRRGE